MPLPDTLVFLHGWSVTSTDTYGGLPERLAAEYAARGQALQLRDIHLGRYVSFQDEVRMEDLARALQAAVERELGALIQAGRRFAVITHSTGGPLAREWWWRYYAQPRGALPCPMSHLVMLAPANFGSALAQLGKGRLSRIKTFAQGVEPGAGVLDWLEQGSPEAWALNEAWCRGRFGLPGAEDGRGVYPFVLTGQSIDRKLYDHLNPYTGESGSDGVVRVSSANLNAALLVLEQGRSGDLQRLEAVGGLKRAPRTAFRLMAGAAHSGKAHGILRSVSATAGGQGTETVQAVLRCLEVDSGAAYATLCDAFEQESERVEAAERVEIEAVPVLPDRVHLHDRSSLVIFRLQDSEGYALKDYDLVLTGAQDSPNLLPAGFLRDRQRNSRHPGTLSFLFDHDLMTGCSAVPDPRRAGAELRAALPGVDRLGLKLRPRPEQGFVRYAQAVIHAEPTLLRQVLRPNQATLIDLRLQRLVDRANLEFGPAGGAQSFKGVKPAGEVVP
ncbi:MAG: phospholipase [Xanthomonadales bacterium]|nr:phospholipase [Xanthomonadales bacterium]